jgi:hypothetical protein
MNTSTWQGVPEVVRREVIRKNRAAAKTSQGQNPREVRIQINWQAQAS